MAKCKVGNSGSRDHVPGKMDVRAIKGRSKGSEEC